MNTLYFEDFFVGQYFDSPGRTVTESDASLFCMLSGDWHPIHSDDEFARKTEFGRRIVGGVFGIALVTGMMSRWGVFDQSVVAMLSIDDWRFKAPIFIGDTLSVRMEILSMRETSDGLKGVIDRGFAITNQEQKLVQEGRSAALIKRRPK